VLLRAEVRTPNILLARRGTMQRERIRTSPYDPLILVEVVSPSSKARDSGGKRGDYFRLPSLRHYLIVKTENRAIIHHERDTAGAITTRIIRDGPIRLDPPGIELTGLFSTS
jgi:Uma2 family endonuclease